MHARGQGCNQRQGEEQLHKDWQFYRTLSKVRRLREFKGYFISGEAVFTCGRFCC